MSEFSLRAGAISTVAQLPPTQAKVTITRFLKPHVFADIRHEIAQDFEEESCF